jgi:hypothetical protein
LILLTLIIILSISGYIVFYYLFFAVDERRRNIWIYFFGSWIFLIGFIYSLIAATIYFTIYRIFIRIKRIRGPLNRISAKKEVSNFYFLLFKMKLTGFMILLNTNTFIWCIFRLLTSFTILFGRDIFGIEFHILTIPIYSLCAVVTVFVLGMGSFSFTNFKSMYCHFFMRNPELPLENMRLISRQESTNLTEHDADGEVDAFSDDEVEDTFVIVI